MRLNTQGSLVFTILVATACASGSGAASGTAETASTPVPSASASGTTAPKRGSSTLIVEDEIRSAGNQRNVYELIDALRPGFMRMRAGAAASESGNMRIRVYVDDRRYGESVESLRDLGTSGIVEIRRISAADATLRWGTGHDGGVILITTKR